MHTGRDVVEVAPRRGGDGVELARAHRLEERLGEGAADAHCLADGLHLRPERRVGAGELLNANRGNLTTT